MQRVAGFRMSHPHPFSSHLSAWSTHVPQPRLSPRTLMVSANISCPGGGLISKLLPAVSPMQSRGSQWQIRSLHTEWRSGKQCSRRCERIEVSFRLLDRSFTARTAGLGAQGARKATAVCASRNALQEVGDVVDVSREASGEVQGNHPEQRDDSDFVTIEIRRSFNRIRMQLSSIY